MLRSSVIFVLSALLLIPSAEAQAARETLLSTENAYNPIPSPDGKYIAYVRTGWGRPGGSGGFGRSNLVSEVAVMRASGNPVAKKPLADAFLSGWTPDSTALVCYRDGEYSLVSLVGNDASKGRFSGATNVFGSERVSYLPRLGTMIWSQRDGFRTVLATPNVVLTPTNSFVISSERLSDSWREPGMIDGIAKCRVDGSDVRVPSIRGDLRARPHG